MDWISIKDKLPEVNKEVIVCAEDNTYWWGIITDSGNFYVRYGDGWAGKIVTHWMPLPKIPERKMHND